MTILIIIAALFGHPGGLWLLLPALVFDFVCALFSNN
jgi:hypothetical protein